MSFRRDLSPADYLGNPQYESVEDAETLLLTGETKTRKDLRRLAAETSRVVGVVLGTIGIAWFFGGYMTGEVSAADLDTTASDRKGRYSLTIDGASSVGQEGVAGLNWVDGQLSIGSSGSFLLSDAQDTGAEIFSTPELGMNIITGFEPKVGEAYDEAVGTMTYDAYQSGRLALTDKITVFSIVQDAGIMARDQGRPGHDKQIDAGLFIDQVTGLMNFATRDNSSNPWEFSPMAFQTSTNDKGETVITAFVAGAGETIPMFEIVQGAESSKVFFLTRTYSDKIRRIMMVDVKNNGEERVGENNFIDVLAGSKDASALPAPDLAPATMTTAELEKGIASGDFVENEDGSYSIKDSQGNVNPDIKFFKDGTVDLTYNSIKYTVAFEATKINSNGEGIYSLWNYENGVVTMAPGYTAEQVKAGELEKSENELVIRRGKAESDNDFQKRLTEMVFAARDLYMDHTEGYQKASEFADISITVNSKTIDNFDPRPAKWAFVNKSTIDIYKGQFAFYPQSAEEGVVYEDDATLEYARPMQVALGAGWFRVKIINSDGATQAPIIHVPVVAMDTNGSVVNSSAFLRQSDLPRIAHLLTREERGKLWFRLHTQAYKDPYSVDDLELAAFEAEVNSGFCQAVRCPNKNEELYIFKLPKEFSALIFTLQV